MHAEEGGKALYLSQRNTHLSKLGVNQSFSKKELQSIIKNLKNNKAEGYDSISNEMIKYASINVLGLLHCFINLLGKISDTTIWMFRYYKSHLQEGSQDDLSNYRGICISSVLLKIICSLLNNRLQTFCSKFNLISDNQTGFKKDHRNSDHLFTLKNIVEKNVTIGEGKLLACFVEF